MKKILIKLIILQITIFSFLFSENNEHEFDLDSRVKLQSELSRVLFRTIMDAKLKVNNLDFRNREEVLTNLTSTAPRTEFIINADLTEEFGNSILSSSIKLSTNGQQSWISTNNLGLIGSSGFENSWHSTIQNSGSNAVHWFISALVNSEAVGQDQGEIIVSQSPNNFNGQWPPSNNFYATLSTDASGDASSGQDITSIFASYKGSFEVPEGNTEKLYLGMNLSGGCCDDGSTFGPWFLYGVGIVNPDAVTPVAYAVGYGNGGFGELTPGLLKLSGDISTGEISGFDYITTYIDWTQMGNQLHTSLLMDYITNDPDWGPWPNSMNSVILVGMTVSADISSNVTIIDQSDPGLFILSTQTQDGNITPGLSNLLFDETTSQVSIDYLDVDNNLPWKHSVSICDENNNCDLEIELIPNNHEYSIGVNYSAILDINTLIPGEYYLKVRFNDSDADDQELLLYDFISFSGCNDIDACNFIEGAYGCEDGGFSCCEYSEINFDCLGNCISEIDCFGVCGGVSAIDDCGICGGLNDCNCPGYPEGTTPDCFGVCGGDASFDECGVCGGNGIPVGYCDCEGHVMDECNICGGSGISDGYCDCNENTLDCTGNCGGDAIADECGICEGDDSCLGCIDQLALNFNPDATLNDGECIYNPATEFSAIFNEDESVSLSWIEPVTGPTGPCPNESEILDCNGNCGPESWIGDGGCDDGTYFYSVTYGYCGTDPLALPSEDCISILFECDDFPEETGDCNGENCPEDYIMDCNGICAPYSWIGDGYCDVGQWGAFLYCDGGSWDGGDCGSCSDLNEVQDCNGDCWPYDVIGDGWCDEDGIVNWDPFDFEEDYDCSAFGYDGGDCSGEPELLPLDNNNIQFVMNKLPHYLTYKFNDLILERNNVLREEIAYQIIRNGNDIAETSGNNYIDFSPQYGENCYSVTVLYPYGESDSTTIECIYADLEVLPGDSNSDGTINVVDIVLLVGYIMDETTELNFQASDLNGDGEINVVDIVLLVGLILDE